MRGSSIIYRKLLCCLALLQVIICYAQSPVVRNIQKELHDTRVNCIYRDSDGFIWLGTGTGVEHFDGVQSVCYPFERKSFEPESELVNALIETRPHELYAGNVRGLWKLNHDTRLPERLFADKIDFWVQALAKDRDNVLYIGTPNGLYTYDGQELKHFLINKNALSDENRILALCPDNDRMWLLTSGSIAVLHLRSGLIKNYACPEQRLTCFTPTKDMLYVGTEDRGIISFDRTSCRFAPFMNSWSSPISCLSSDGKGHLYAGTSGEGLCFITLKDKKIYYTARHDPSQRKSIASNMVASLLVDPEKRIAWVGSKFYTGLDYLRFPNSLTSIYRQGDFNTSSLTIRSFLKQGDTRLIGTREGFYYLPGKGKPRYFCHAPKDSNGLRSNLIFSFHYYNGQYLIGTCAGGLSVLDTASMRLHDFEPTGMLTRNDIFTFQEDEDHNLWIATSDGLYFYNHTSGALKTYTPTNSSLPGHLVYSILIDSRYRFWVATENGLCLFDRRTETFHTDRFPAYFIHPEIVRYIYEDRDGNLFFVFLEKTGIFQTDKDLEHSGFLADGADLGAYNIVQDNDGHYWVGSHRGPIRINNTLDNFSLCLWNEELPAFSITAGSPSMKDESGTLWFCSTNGLIRVQPSLWNTASPLILMEIKINGETVYNNFNLEEHLSDNITLEEDEDNVTFHFASPDYESSENRLYEYWLEGKDTTWTITSQCEVSYFNLPEGDYIFRVRKWLDDSTVASFPFSVEDDVPAWIYTLGALLFIIILIFLLRIKKRKRTKMPKVLLIENAMPMPDATTSSSGKEERYKLSKLSEEEAHAIIGRMTAYMQAAKPYLNPDFKQSDLAAGIGCSTQIISQVLNTFLHTRYYDFVNQYRVEEFKRQIKEIDYTRYTLTSLAEQCGFSSQATFFRFFKKFTGITPNEYIHNQEET